MSCSLSGPCTFVPQTQQIRTETRTGIICKQTSWCGIISINTSRIGRLAGKCMTVLCDTSKHCTHAQAIAASTNALSSASFQQEFPSELLLKDRNGFSYITVDIITRHLLSATKATMNVTVASKLKKRGLLTPFELQLSTCSTEPT